MLSDDNGNTFWMIKIPISDRSLVVSFLKMISFDF